MQKFGCLFVAAMCLLTYVSGQCDMHITYDATIASSQDDQGPVSFLAEFNMHNHNAEIEAWRLAFQLSNGEELGDISNVLTPDVYVDPASTISDIAIEAANQSFKNGTGAQVKFIGTKDLSKYNATVAAVTAVEFNNVKCEEVKTQESVLEVPAYVNTSDYKVEVDFRPIEIVAKDGSTSQQQQVFHIDLVSLSATSLYLPYLKLQYYFAGGLNDMLAKPSDYIALCLASESFICTDLTFNITPGVQGVDGAKYLLEIGFKENSGYLLHNTTGPNTPMFTTVPQTQELAYQVISFTLALESQIAYNYLDIKNDYSSVETELEKYINSTSGGKISQRTSVPDNKVPVYHSDELIAGVTPQWEKYLVDSKNGAEEYDPTSCVADDMSGNVYCSVQAKYCCVGDTSAAITLTAMPETSPEPSPAVAPEPSPATVDEAATVEQEAHTPTVTEEQKTVQEEEIHTTPATLKSTSEEVHSEEAAHSPSESSGEESTIESSTVVLVILLAIVAVVVVAGLVVFIQRRRASDRDERLQVELRNTASGEGQALNQYYDAAKANYK